MMDQDDQQDAASGQQEEDSQRFEKATRELREKQSPSTGDEGTEEDRQQGEKTRDISKEASKIPEEANGQQHRTGGTD
jgi:hypothetical protein